MLNAPVSIPKKDVSWLNTFNNSNQHIRSDKFDVLFDGLNGSFDAIIEKKSVDEKKIFFLAKAFIKIAVIKFWAWNDFSNHRKKKDKKKKS